MIYLDEIWQKVKNFLWTSLKRCHDLTFSSSLFFHQHLLQFAMMTDYEVTALFLGKIKNKKKAYWRGGAEQIAISTQQRCSKYRSVYIVGCIKRNRKCQPDCFARTPLFSSLLAVIWCSAGSEWIIVDCVLAVTLQMYCTQKRSFLCFYLRWEFYLFFTESIDNRVLIFRRPGRCRGISVSVGFNERNWLWLFIQQRK